MTLTMPQTMIRVSLGALAMLLALSGAATAQTPSPVPALRASVTVTGDLVRIGDLVENAGPVADIPIFRAPDLGTTGAVSTDRIVEAIQPHQLIDIDTRGLAEVVVTRASRAITPQDISTRISQALAGQYGLGDARNISLQFDRAPRTLQLEPGATGPLQVLAVNFDQRTSRFDVTLDLPTSLVLHQQPARYTGIAVATVETVEVNRPVERGEVVQASDLTTMQRPRAQGAGGITDIAAAAGLAARHQLRPGRPLVAADLTKPEIIQRNETITLVYEAPGLMLTLRGTAQDGGALGDTIGVLNVQTKRIVQGVIVGPGRVNVSAGSTVHLAEPVDLAENLPPPPRRPEAAPAAAAPAPVVKTPVPVPNASAPLVITPALVGGESH